ncbi:MAG: GGDEF domain-containing protein [Acidobacteriota bacterium]
MAMTPEPIGVLTEDPELIRTLQSRCPEFVFVEVGRIPNAVLPLVVFDADSWKSEAGNRARARLYLERSGAPAPSGVTSIGREGFIAAPRPFLRLGLDIAAQSERAAMLAHLRELLSLPEIGPLAEKITRAVLELLELPYGSFLLNDTKTKGFVTVFTQDPDHTEGTELGSGGSPDLLRRALAADGMAVDPPGEGIDGTVLFPMQTEQELIGVLTVPLPSALAFDQSRLSDARAYLDSILPVLRNAYQLTRARELALMDDLTRCFNRRFFEAYLDDEMERARRHRSVLSVIFLDLDDLKMVNNAYGHLAGSSVLQEVARRIMSGVRTIDKVIRFGGDEFCIILPQTGQEQATAVASRVRDAIGSEPCIVESEVAIDITASFGIASYPVHATSKEDLISAADAAMLLVKSTTKDEIGVARAIDLSRGQARW